MGEPGNPQLLFDWQPPLLNSFGIVPNLGQPNLTASSISNRMVMKNGFFPVNSPLKVPDQLQVGLVHEPCSWLPCFGPPRQAFFPVKGPVYNDELEVLSKGPSKEAMAPLLGSENLQKGIIVIDQSADKTTLVLCSGGGGPLQVLTSWSPQPPSAYKFNEFDIGTKGDLFHDPKLVLTDNFIENHETDDLSEMQEDSEELNALLYSDDESEFDEDEEVTSTGHSPSSMTVKDKRCACEALNEEVANSAESVKKRKIDVGYDVTSLTDTANSLMARRSSEHEDDAESSCGNEGSGDTQDVNCSYTNKKRKILETVGILQSLIPGGKGKEAIVVLDEAIQYLTSLRLKAEAIGLNAF